MQPFESLSAIYKRKRTVLVFYCGAWCPYCNAYLADLMTIKKQAAAHGFRIIAIILIMKVLGLSACRLGD
jgi:peroxiredoxin